MGSGRERERGTCYSAPPAEEGRGREKGGGEEKVRGTYIRTHTAQTCNAHIVLTALEHALLHLWLSLALDAA